MINVYTDIIPTYHTWVVMGSIATAVVSYSWGKISNELTSISIIGFLLGFFYLFPDKILQKKLLSSEEIFQTFANPALITITSFLIIGSAVVRSGVISKVPPLLMKVCFGKKYIVIFVTMISVLIFSAFMNNTPVVVMFIPVMMKIARQFQMHPSKIMMQLSYVSILGGMLTLVGTSTNILISGSMEKIGLPPFAFFEFIKPGSVIVAVALLYLFFVAPYLLPKRGKDDVNQDTRGFFVDFKIPKDFQAIGKKILDSKILNKNNLKIKLLTRNNKTHKDVDLINQLNYEEGDILTISGHQQDITHFLIKYPESILNNNRIYQYFEQEEIEKLEESIEESEKTFEIVIMPGSKMIGKTIKQLQFLEKFEYNVVSIHKRANIVQQPISQYKVTAGDVLTLISSRKEERKRVENNNDFFVSGKSTIELFSLPNAVKSLSIFVSTILLSAFNVMPMSIASFLGVMFVLGLGCINLQQMYRAIEGNVILIIAASLTMGLALQTSGGAGLIANSIANLLHGMSPMYVIAVMFVVIVIMTNFLSNNSTAVIFTPIAANIAIQLNIDLTPIIYAVVFASSCAFITPIGYQTNLLVMGMGKYKFNDFYKVGIPLSVLIWATYLIYTYFVWF